MTLNLPRPTCAVCGHRDAIKMEPIDETGRLWWLCGPCDSFAPSDPVPDQRFARAPIVWRRVDTPDTVQILRAVAKSEPATLAQIAERLDVDPSEKRAYETLRASVLRLMRRGALRATEVIPGKRNAGFLYEVSCA